MAAFRRLVSAQIIIAVFIIICHVITSHQHPMPLVSLYEKTLRMIVPTTRSQMHCIPIRYRIPRILRFFRRRIPLVVYCIPLL